jgi:hypothetical protein
MKRDPIFARPCSGVVLMVFSMLLVSLQQPLFGRLKPGFSTRLPMEVTLQSFCQRPSGGLNHQES